MAPEFVHIAGICVSMVVWKAAMAEGLEPWMIDAVKLQLKQQPFHTEPRAGLFKEQIWQLVLVLKQLPPGESD